MSVKPNPDRFRLVSYVSKGGSTVEFTPLVDEPLRYDALNIIGKRDMKYFGFNYVHDSGSIQLEFDYPAAMEKIQEIYDRDGSDGYILLQRVAFDTGPVVIESWRLNLNTLRILETKVACSLEEDNIQDLVKSRFDTPIDLRNVKSLGNVTIGACPLVDTTLRSKVIRKEFIRNRPYEATSSPLDWTAGDTGVRSVYYSLGMDLDPNPSSGDKDDLSSSEAGDFTISAYNYSPEGRSLYSFLIMEESDFQLDINTTITINLDLWKKDHSTRKPRIEYYTITGLVTYDKNGTTEEQVIYTSTGYTSRHDLGDTPINLAYSVYRAQGTVYALPINTKVYIYVNISFNNPTSSDFQTGWSAFASGTMKLTLLTRAAETKSKHAMIYEACKQTVLSVTDNKVPFKSDFLDRITPTQHPYWDAGGAYNIVADGWSIRNFDPVKPFTVSMKQLLSSLNAMYCMGMGYEGIGSSRKIVYEYVNYFFRDVEIIELGIDYEPFDYTEEVAVDFIYNQVDVNYSKHISEAEKGLEEFATSHTYLTSITTHDNKLDLKIDFVASGDLIERARREQYTAATKDKTTSDDESTFIIAVLPDGVNKVKSETNEPFDLVDNLENADSAYNLRHHIKRVMQRWSYWLNSSLKYKLPSDIIKSTSFINNGEVVTKFKVTEPNNIGESAGHPKAQDNANIVLGTNNDGKRIFIPDWVNFKIKIDDLDVEHINDCMRNLNTTGQNYGYITINVSPRKKIQGWLYEINHTPNKREAAIKLLKKQVIIDGIVIPVVCTDFKDFTFTDFENPANIIPDAIEDCIFDNFN